MDVERLSAIIRDASARFLDNQSPGCHVPRLQSFFPKSIEASGGNVSQVERRRAVTTHALRMHDEVGEMPGELVTLPHVVGKACAQERAPQDPCLRNANATA